jgi:hypothetical protein
LVQSCASTIDAWITVHTFHRRAKGELKAIKVEGHVLRDSSARWYSFGGGRTDLWMIAYCAGYHVTDGGCYWNIFPMSVLLLGFPHVDLSHPKLMLLALISTLVANVIFFVLLVFLILTIWRLLRRV